MTRPQFDGTGRSARAVRPATLADILRPRYRRLTAPPSESPSRASAGARACDRPPLAHAPQRAGHLPGAVPRAVQVNVVFSPSSAVRLQLPIMLGCTCYRAASPAIVPSPRIAAKALKSGEKLRRFAILVGSSRQRKYHLITLSEFWGPLLPHQALDWKTPNEYLQSNKDCPLSPTSPEPAQLLATGSVRCS